jgi:hypothetical protein
MTLERTLRLTAAIFILVSLALGHWVNHYWYLFTAFIGVNLFQSGFTNWCPMMTFLRKLGLGSQKETEHASLGLGDCISSRLPSPNAVASAETRRPHLKKQQLCRVSA